MTMLSEDPTLLAGGLALLGAAFLVALKVTQQGRYLLRAGVAFGLAALVVGIEWSWVTDAERVERVVHELRAAVASSDVDGVLEHLAPNVQFGRTNGILEPGATRSLIRSTLSGAVFDLVRVTQLRTNVGKQSRRGTAEFRVFAKGRVDSQVGAVTIGTADSEWSLGFQEVEPHVWKVNRITPVSVPDGVLTRERIEAPEHSGNQAPRRFRGR